MKSVKRLFGIIGIIGIIGLLGVLAGCDRRDLEVYYENKVAIRIDVDWMREFEQMPSGMTLMLYQDGDTLTYNSITNEVTSKTVMLEPGTYYLTLFNQSYDEFGSMYFENLVSHHNAAARAENITTRANRRWDYGVRYMTDPEDIGVAVDTFTITEEMLEQQLRFVDWHQHANVSPNIETTYVYNEVPYPMTTTLNVRVNVKGAKSISNVEASISGMADGFYLSRVDRTTSSGTMLLDHWTFTPADETRTYGTIKTSISTFGLPFGKEMVANRDSTDNVLSLNFFLRDNTEAQYTFNVGKIMRYLTPTGDALTKAEALKHIEVEIYIEDPVIIPDVDPTNASGFDAQVDEWEDGGTFEFSF